jgi:cytochrome c553
MKPLSMPLIAIGILTFSTAQAAQLPAPQDSAAERVAVGVCSACHGARGLSNVPRFPVLAGQTAGYISAQLKAFKEHARADADAQSFMWGIAGSLPDEQIEAVSQYYAAQPPLSLAAPSSGAAEIGRQIFDHGIESRHVPACAVCHGAQARGVAEIPGLAGQQPAYFLTQMRAFTSGERRSETMRGIAMPLEAAELDALASYIRSR